ncbi:MAG: hypothetical protein IBV52_06875 [Candidatus Bathyarchaeota archaeon]
MQKPEVQLKDLIRLAEISANNETSYVRPEEVRKNLIKAGFERGKRDSEKGDETCGIRI